MPKQLFNNDKPYASTNAFKKTHRLHMHIPDSVLGFDPISTRSIPDSCRVHPMGVSTPRKHVLHGRQHSETAHHALKALLCWAGWTPRCHVVREPLVGLLGSEFESFEMSRGNPWTSNHSILNVFYVSVCWQTIPGMWLRDALRYWVPCLLWSSFPARQGLGYPGVPVTWDAWQVWRLTRRETHAVVVTVVLDAAIVSKHSEMFVIVCFPMLSLYLAWGLPPGQYY